MTSTSRHMRAILFAITGFTFWVMCDTVNKFNMEQNVPKHLLVIWGSLSGIVTIVLWAAITGKLKAYKVTNPKRVLGYSCLMPCNFFLIVVALEHLPLTTFYAVAFIAPLCVSVAAAWLFRETLTWKKIAAIGIGFCGVIIAIDPSSIHVGSDNALGIGAVLLSAGVFTAQSLAMRGMSKTESKESLVTYPRVLAMSVGIVAALVLGHPAIPWMNMLYIVSTGVIGSIGWLLVAYAYQWAPAATVAPFHYSQIISGAIFGYIFWSDVPSLHLMVGVAIIILSGLYIVWHTKTTVIEAEDKASGR